MGMVDINYTILVQLANFIVLIFILNALLLKPVLRHLSARDSKIQGSHDEAKENADRAEQLMASFEAELADARLKANQAFNSHQQEGIAGQREKLTAAKAEAQQILEKAQAELAGEAAKARQVLQSEMEKLPKEIASKLLGRSI
jgi:F-type H+-transporting ATPase subunit b